MKELIIEVFARHKIEWGEWDYQMCPFLERIVERLDSNFSPICRKTIEHPTEVEITRIATYLTAISKAVSLPSTTRTQLRNDLLDSMHGIFKSETISGNTEYGVAYTVKH